MTEYLPFANFFTFYRNWHQDMKILLFTFSGDILYLIYYKFCFFEWIIYFWPK